jgi:hypothetical protein
MVNQAEKLREKFEALNAKINHFFQNLTDLIGSIFNVLRVFFFGLTRTLIELWAGLFKISWWVTLLFIILFPIPMLWLIGKELSSGFGFILKISAFVFAIPIVILVGVTISSIVKGKELTEDALTKKDSKLRSDIILLFILIDVVILLAPSLLPQEPKNDFLKLLYSTYKQLKK